MSGCELDGPQHRGPWLGLHDSGNCLGSEMLPSQLYSNHPSGCFLNVLPLKCVCTSCLYVSYIVNFAVSQT